MTSPRIRRPVLAATLLAAGLTAVVVGLLRNVTGLPGSQIGPRVDPLSGGLTWPAVVVGVVAALLLAAPGLAASGRAPRLGVGSALGLAALLGLALLPVVTLRSVDIGGPSSSAAIVIVGAAAAALGALVLAGRTVRPPRGPRRVPAAVTALAVAVVVAVLAVAGGVVGTDLTVIRTTGDAPAADAPVPVRPTAVRWTWAARDRVVAVQRGGPGVVVTDGDAVVGLDSVTGTERWRYARGGPALDSVVISPDGRTVVVGHRNADRNSPARLAVLDGVSGARRWEVAGDDAVYGLGGPSVTDRVVGFADGQGITARDAVTGEPVWRWERPPGCPQRYDATSRTLDAIPVICDAPGAGSMVGIDDRTGELRWSVPGDPADGPRPRITTLADGRTVLYSGDRGARLVDPGTGAVRGAVPAVSDSIRIGWTPRGSGLQTLVAGRVAGVDPGTGATYPQPAPCASEQVVLVRRPGTPALSFCPDGPVLGVEGGPPVRVTLPPAPSAPPAGADADPVMRPGQRFLVPAPGAVVVADGSPATAGAVVGLG